MARPESRPFVTCCVKGAEMGYLAKWVTVVDGEDLDPLEIARRAHELLLDPHRNCWVVKDLTAGRTAAVDLYEQRVIRPESSSSSSSPADDDAPPF